MKLPNIRSTESNQMSMSRIFLQSVSLCLLFVKSSLFLKSPDYLFEESRLFVQSSGSKCTVYMCLLFVRSVSLRLKSLALLRAAIKSYSKLVLYSPKTGNIFSEKKIRNFWSSSVSRCLGFCEDELDFKVGTFKHHRSTKLNLLLGRC